MRVGFLPIFSHSCVSSTDNTVWHTVGVQYRFPEWMNLPLPSLHILPEILSLQIMHRVFRCAHSWAFAQAVYPSSNALRLPLSLQDLTAFHSSRVVENESIGPGFEERAASLRSPNNLL